MFLAMSIKWMIEDAVDAVMDSDVVQAVAEPLGAIGLGAGLGGVAAKVSPLVAVGAVGGGVGVGAPIVVVGLAGGALVGLAGYGAYKGVQAAREQWA